MIVLLKFVKKAFDLSKRVEQSHHSFNFCLPSVAKEEIERGCLEFIRSSRPRTFKASHDVPLHIVCEPWSCVRLRFGFENAAFLLVAGVPILISQFDICYATIRLSDLLQRKVEKNSSFPLLPFYSLFFFPEKYVLLGKKRCFPLFCALNKNIS